MRRSFLSYLRALTELPYLKGDKLIKLNVKPQTSRKLKIGKSD